MIILFKTVWSFTDYISQERERIPDKVSSFYQTLSNIVIIIYNTVQNVGYRKIRRYWNFSLFIFVSHNWILNKVCGKTLSTFCFWISWLPRGLEIPTFTFFKGLFHVDVKNIHFFHIIRWNLDWDIGKILYHIF